MGGGVSRPPYHIFCCQSVVIALIDKRFSPKFKLACFASDQVKTRRYHIFGPTGPHFCQICIFAIFPPKSGCVTFYPLSMSNFMQKIKKILWPVIEKKSGQTDERTDERTDMGQSIGPTSEVGGSKNQNQDYQSLGWWDQDQRAREYDLYYH